MPDLPVTLTVAALAFVVTALGAALQGAVGFGLGLLAAPLLLLIHPPFVPGPMLAGALVLTVLVAARDHRAIDFGGLKFAIAGRVVTTLPAAYLVSILSMSTFDLVFGSLIIVGVVLSLVGKWPAPTRKRALAAGALSGFMATTSAVGGPPMALLYQRAESVRLRGTLAGFFTFGASFSLVALAIFGRFGRSEIGLMLVLVPGILVGFALSIPLARRLDRGSVRPAVLALSLASALVVLLRALA